jgi:ABC-type polysaccharide/polyol phosphate transport system ATPase subunit
VKNRTAVELSNITKRFVIKHSQNSYLKDLILKKRDKYEEFLALDNISLKIGQNETFGIIGSNGSGKSTLLKLIAKVLKPTTGKIVVNGTTSALLELGAGFHPDLTGRENIYINASILGLKRKEIKEKFEEIVEFSELEQFIDMPVKNYSSGMYMRLGFSIAIKVNPNILLIDEVLAVGDQSFQAKCYKVIYDFMHRGKTIIIVSHDLDTISDLCHRVVFLKNGRIDDIGDSIKVVNKYRAYVEEIERMRIEEQQKEERKKIFKAVIDSKRKIVDGEEINKLTNMGADTQFVNRFGSGDAEVVKIEMLDGSGKLINYCNYGDIVQIVFKVKCNKKVEYPIFGIRISDHRNNIVYGTNSKLLGIKTEVFKQGEEISVVFRQPMYLIGGEYWVTVSVGNKDTKTYCDWVNNIMALNVMRREFAEGIADLDSTVLYKRLNTKVKK